MARRVFLHIGAPKTGTTYLQDRWELNAKALASRSIHYPGGSLTTSASLAQFRAALDLRGQDWGGPPGHAHGAWDALMRKVRRLHGTVIISHEILAPATSGEVARAKRDLAGSELHIVYSARDLSRLVPAAWQESIKQGRRWSYDKFVRRIQNGRSFWMEAFDVPDVLGTWADGLPPERVHIVTVPRGDSSALWNRTCAVLGMDPGWAPEESTRRNPSLGIPETEMLRQLNRRMDREFRRNHDVNALVAGRLAERRLVRRRSPQLLLPPAAHPWAEEQAQRWIDWITAAGVDVAGDLDDLRPAPPVPPEEYRGPAQVTHRRKLEAALDALAVMTQEAANRPDPRQRLSAKVRRKLRNG